MAELKTIITAQHDSGKDKFLGLEVRYVTVIVVSLLLSLIPGAFLFMGESASTLSFTTKILVTFSPFFATTSYIIYFFLNRMPHFHYDFWQKAFGGKNHKVRPLKQVSNPYMESNR